MQTEQHILDVNDLAISFRGPGRRPLRAVDGISFSVREGERVGIVGESGCGKSATALSILRLHDEGAGIGYSGRIEFAGENVLEFDKKKLQAYRRTGAAMIFQDPLSSLNPVFTIHDQLAESVRMTGTVPPKEVRDAVIRLLADVGIPDPEARLASYPHELSGGMRQRIMIAMALARRPALLVADEPTTALDVTIQAQIIDLLLELNETRGTALLLISHDLGVIAQVCERVIVMYRGVVVEDGPVDEVLHSPSHPYTRGLISSTPEFDGPRVARLTTIPGTVPSLGEEITGCRFRSRCSLAQEICGVDEPPLTQHGHGGARSTRCWFPLEQTTEGGV